MPEESIAHIDFEELNQQGISQPLVKHIYTADPSAHVFNGKIYIYPSHDIENDIPFDDLGSHFAMEDYHVIVNGFSIGQNSNGSWGSITCKRCSLG